MVSFAHQSTPHRREDLGICYCTGGRSWFLSPANRSLAKASVFYLLDDNNNGVGVGVFFSETRAVTADHNLLDQHSIGSGVEAIIPGDQLQELGVMGKEVCRPLGHSHQPAAIVSCRAPLIDAPKCSLHVCSARGAAASDCAGSLS